MKIGLVTVLFNSNDVLPDFFSSIAVQDYTNYILYLIDNSPSIQTKELINTLQLKYKLTAIQHIENSYNYGVAAANNMGIKAAIKDGCQDQIILNNDIVFNNTNLFTSLINIASQSSAVVIAPKVYYYNTKQIWYAGSNFIEWSCNVKHRGEFEEDIQQYESGFTQYAPTCFVYVKKEVFTTVGFMDETYFVYVDDLDFMYRLRKLNYSIWYENSLSIDHKISQSTGGKFSAFSVFYGVRNRIYFARKFYTLPNKIIVTLYVFASIGYHIVFLQKKIQLIPTLFKGIYKGWLLKTKTA